MDNVQYEKQALLWNFMVRGFPYSFIFEKVRGFYLAGWWISRIS